MRHDVYYYFQQACRRELRSPEPRHWVEQGDATAAFRFDVGTPGRIDAVDYRCTTCMTLVALCEHVAQELRGATVEKARSLTAGQLLSHHPEIPPMRRSRAELAVKAAHAALESVSQ